MTSTIERESSASDGSPIVIAVFVVLVVAIGAGLFAFGSFDRQPSEARVTIEIPPAAPAPSAAPTAPAAPDIVPTEAQPVPAEPSQVPAAPPQ